MRLLILSLFLYSCASPSGANDFDDVEPQGEASALTDVELHYFSAESLTGLAEAKCGSNQLAVGGSCDCFAGDEAKNGILGYCRMDDTRTRWQVGCYSFYQEQTEVLAKVTVVCKESHKATFVTPASEDSGPSIQGMSIRR